MTRKNPVLLYRLLALVFLIFALFFGILHFSGKAKDTRAIRTHVSLTTQELFVQLEEKENEDLAHYIEKAIEVKGVIKEVTFRNGIYSIVLDGNNGDRNILCEMQKDQNSEILALEVGQEVVVKGILKGFLLDAILLNCIVV